MNELISIVVPVYNVEKYIEKCLQSIINQTYKNIEIIVVNDGTKDNSLELAKKVQKKDKRITIISQPNAGLSAARNTGIAHAKGKYINFIDSDDYIEPTMIEELYNLVIKEKAEISICDFIEESEDGIVLKEKISKNEIQIYDSVTGIKELLLQENITNHAWNKLYKKELFNNVQYPVGQLMEDISTTYKLFSNSNKIVYSDKKLYHYIQRGTSILGNVNPKRIKDQYFAIQDRNKKLQIQYPDLLKYITVDNIKLSKDIFYLSYISGNFDICEPYEFNKLYDLAKKEYPEHKKLVSEEHKKSCELYFKSKFLYATYLLILKSKGKNIFKYAKFIFRKKFNTLWEQYKINRGKEKIKYGKNDKKAFIFLAADYPNYGDIAITYAQSQLLKETLKDYQIIEIPSDKTYSYIKDIKNKINQDDLITIVGGGNMSNKYEYYENLRRIVLKEFKKERIICFPQTADYTNDKYGKKEYQKTRKAIEKCKNITLIAREEKTYKLFKETIKKSNVNICLYPDIVLYLKNSIKNNEQKRTNITGICFRNDQEEVEETKHLKDEIIKNIPDKEFFETHDEKKFNYEQRYIQLFDLLKEISKYKLVYTDRLHAMIFCYLTDTECIYIDNSNKKISNTHKLWLSDSKQIKSFDNNINKKNTDIKSKYDELKKIIRKEKENG